MGALSVTGQPKYRDGFGPLVDARALRAVRRRRRRARRDHRAHGRAVIVEPIQAEGGINLPPPGYLQELRRACTDAGAVLIFDEIQTGTAAPGRSTRSRARASSPTS